MNSFLFNTQLIISMTLQANDDELKPFAMSDAAPDALGQLNNLGTDPGETVNLYLKTSGDRV